MRFRSLALAALMGCNLSCPILARASVEGDALLFLDSQVLPRKAAACSARISGFSSQFEPVFRAWLATNRSRIAAGEAYLRADAERTRTPFERDVQSIAGNISQQWNAAPLSMLQENCDAMLIHLKEAPDSE
jgi:hypothetical protein